MPKYPMAERGRVMSDLDIRVLIADDDAVIRNGLADLLEAQEDISIVARAENGVEAVAAVG